MLEVFSKFNGLNFVNMDGVDVIGFSGGFCFLWDGGFNVDMVVKFFNFVVFDILFNSIVEWSLVFLYGAFKVVNRNLVRNQLYDILNFLRVTVLVIGDFN